MVTVRDFAPPLVVKAARRIRRRTRPVQHGQQQDAAFYDERVTERFLAAPRDSAYYFLWTVIADRVANGSHRRVFDLGCGTGQLDLLLADFGVEGLVGLDFSAERVKVAERTNPGFRYVVADATTADLRAFDYTVTVCTEFLEHIDADIETVARLRPATQFIGTVPNFGGEAHVRHFTTVWQVQERYMQVLDNLHVRAFDAPGRPGTTFFVLDGIVRPVGR